MIMLYSKPKQDCRLITAICQTDRQLSSLSKRAKNIDGQGMRICGTIPPLLTLRGHKIYFVWRLKHIALQLQHSRGLEIKHSVFCGCSSPCMLDGLSEDRIHQVWGVKLIRLKAGKVVTLSASNFMDYLAGSMQARES